MKPLVTVGIVNYNAMPFLPGCVDSVHGLQGVQARIIVLDNASVDGSRDWLQGRFASSDVILNETNVGFARAHNQIIRRMEGGYYLALNPDVSLAPDYAQRVIAELDARRDSGWGTGRIYRALPDATPLYSTGHALLRSGYAFNIDHEGTGVGRSDEAREVFGANAAAVLYKAELVHELLASCGEFFDETMFLYYEDVDLDWRARLLGWRCLHVPQAQARHIGDYSGASRDPWLTTQGLANRYRSVLKNAFWQDLLFYNMPLMFLHLMLRSALAPSIGARVVLSLVNDLPLIWRKRRSVALRRRATREEMVAWFEWSRHQASSISVSSASRIRRLFAGFGR
jgi:GT2 family glycosyltransferase